MEDETLEILSPRESVSCSRRECSSERFVPNFGLDKNVPRNSILNFVC